MMTSLEFPRLQDAVAVENAYAISMQKGGVGKTTASICIAAAAARRQRKTLLVDLDPQASATRYFKYLLKEPIKDSMFNLMIEGKAVEPIRLGRYISLLPGSIDLAAAPHLLTALPTTKDLPNLVLARYLAPYSRLFDRIIIDCPPSLDLLTKNALTAARFVIIPFSAEEMAEDALPLILTTIKDVRRDARNGSNPHLEVRCLLPTFFMPKGRASNASLKRVQETYSKDYYIYPLPAHRRAAYQDAVGNSVDVGALDADLAQYWNDFTSSMIFQESKVAPQ